MLKKAIALAALLSLTGCYQTMDQAAREQAAAEVKDQELTQTQAAWTQVVATVPTVRASLVQSDFDKARKDLDVVYRHLYGVVTARDLTPEVRSRVTRLFPTLIQLQAKVDAKDKEAAVLADKLGDMLRDTNDYMVSSGWLRGGGAGKGAIDEQKEKDQRDKDRPYMDNPAQPKQ